MWNQDLNIQNMKAEADFGEDYWIPVHFWVPSGPAPEAKHSESCVNRKEHWAVAKRALTCKALSFHGERTQTWRWRTQSPHRELQENRFIWKHCPLPIS